MFRASPTIIWFQREPREDKISLYADGTLTYLGNTAGFLTVVMQLIEKFGMYSGFAINWHKSVLLPPDPLPTALPESVNQVQMVTSFKYLSIIVTSDPWDYISLNLKPILQKFKHKCVSWCKLPLTVTGRANLTKMIWAPQLLYILHKKFVNIWQCWLNPPEDSTSPTCSW